MALEIGQPKEVKGVKLVSLNTSNDLKQAIPLPIKQITPLIYKISPIPAFSFTITLPITANPFHHR